VREEVLRATLKADLIGFHTYDYARHFISSCTRILGLEGTPEGVEDNGRCAGRGRARRAPRGGRETGEERRSLGAPTARGRGVLPAAVKVGLIEFLVAA
jgi:hypothetical protein